MKRRIGCDAPNPVSKPAVDPSAFITETATKVFRMTDEALRHFQQLGYIGAFQKPLFTAPPGAAGAGEIWISGFCESAL